MRSDGKLGGKGPAVVVLEQPGDWGIHPALCGCPDMRSELRISPGPCSPIAMPRMAARPAWASPGPMLTPRVVERAPLPPAAWRSAAPCPYHDLLCHLGTEGQAMTWAPSPRSSRPGGEQVSGPGSCGQGVRQCRSASWYEASESRACSWDP